MRRPVLLSILSILAQAAILAAPAAAGPSSERRSGESGGGSSGTRGGGDVVVFPDGGISNADRYFRSPGRRWEITDPIRAELRRAGTILAQFGAEPDGVLDGSFHSPPRRFAKLIHDYVTNRRVRYLLAPRLPDWIPECAGPSVAVQGAMVELVACTDGWTTWLRDDLFLRLPPMAQAAKLVHEGLHRLSDHPSHDVIQETSAGLELAMRLHHEQADLGLEPVLSGIPEGDEPYSEVEMLENLFHGMRHLGLARNGSMARTPEEWMIWPRGGALVSRGASLAWDSYAGIGTVLPAGSSLLQGAKVINSHCAAPGGWPCAMEVGRGAVLRDSAFTNVRYESIRIGNGAEINEMAVHTIPSRDEPPQAGSQARWFHVGNGARISRLWVMGMPGTVSLGDGVRIDSSIFWISANLITQPAGWVQTPVTLVIGDRAAVKAVHPYVNGPSLAEMSDQGKRFVPVFEIAANSSIDLSSDANALASCAVTVTRDRRRVVVETRLEMLSACARRPATN